MIGLVLFGTPGGFEVFPDLPEGSKGDIVEFGRILDLPNYKINIFPNCEIFRILRLKKEETYFFLFCKYIHALEIKNSRGGTFIGGAILSEEFPINPESVLFGLNDLTKELKIKVLGPNSRFLFHLTDSDKLAQAEIKVPISIELLDKAPKISNFIHIKENAKVGFINLAISPKGLPEIIKELLINPLYQDYSDVFISANAQVIESVIEKGELVDISGEKAKVLYLEQEVKSLKENIISLNKSHANELKALKNDNETVRKENQRLSNKINNQNGKKSIDEDAPSTNLPNPSQTLSIDNPEKQNHAKGGKRIKPILKSIPNWIWILCGFFLFVWVTLGTYFLLPDDTLTSVKTKSPIKTREAENIEFKQEKSAGLVDFNDSAEKEKSCDWENRLNKWVYVGNDFLILEDLVNDILKKGELDNCKDGFSQITFSIEKANPKDVKNGKIKKNATVSFWLPQGRQMKDSINYRKFYPNIKK